MGTRNIVSHPQGSLNTDKGRYPGEFRVTNVELRRISPLAEKDYLAKIDYKNDPDDLEVWSKWFLRVKISQGEEYRNVRLECNPKEMTDRSYLDGTYEFTCSGDQGEPPISFSKVTGISSITLTVKGMTEHD